MNSASAIIDAARKRGVEFWLDDEGGLRYRAPTGALSRHEIDELRKSKSQLVALLQLDKQVLSHRAPLTFSQLAHWNLYNLREQPAIRHIASATRLHGLLNVATLRESLLHVIDRHDALRTRIAIVAGVPTQAITHTGSWILEPDDLSTSPEDLRNIEVHQLIEALILEPIDVCLGPLFGVRLIKLTQEDHVFVLAMEHMISDMFSMSLLLEEVFTAYSHLSAGGPIDLPPVSIQLPYHASQQHAGLAAWMEGHGSYWEAKLGGQNRLRFPADAHPNESGNVGWGTAAIYIDAPLKMQLREYCRSRRTTLAMGLLVSYVGFVLRWCHASDGVVQYAIDGRGAPETVRAIGFFASTLFLRVRLLDSDKFDDLLNRITAEYCAAHEHADDYYLATQIPRPDFTRTTMFNFVPHGASMEIAQLQEPGSRLELHPIPFADPLLTHPMLKDLALDYEPMILLHDAGSEILGGVHFPKNRFSSQTMKRAARAFSDFLKILLMQPEQAIKDIILEIGRAHV